VTGRNPKDHSNKTSPSMFIHATVVVCRLAIILAATQKRTVWSIHTYIYIRCNFPLSTIFQRARAAEIGTQSGQINREPQPSEEPFVVCQIVCAFSFVWPRTGESLTLVGDAVEILEEPA
jgi:hypothetical protein